MKHKRFVLSVILVVLTALAVFVGCDIPGVKTEPKDFSKAGMTITLTTEFGEKEFLSKTAYYESMNAIVTVLKEDYELFINAGILFPFLVTLNEYVGLIVNNNPSITDPSEPVTEDGLTYFTYSFSTAGKDFKYFNTVFKTGDAFWFFQFAVLESQFDAQFDTLKTWAKSVRFG